MSVEIVAKMLAGEHMSEDQGIREVYWLPAATEVRLVEVSGSVGDRGEVLPFRFTPDPPEVPYPSVVILLGPGDWDRVRNGELRLPETFGKVDDLERIAIAPAASSG
jgi:hypothetical protein